MDQAEVSSWVKEAEKAFTAASDLDSLKEARLAHLGEMYRRSIPREDIPYDLLLGID